MPSKNIEVRRATWQKWAKQNRLKSSIAYKKYLARQAAQAKYPELQKCSVEKCNTVGERHHPDYEKRLEIVWLCKKHHEAVHHKVKRVCNVDDCELKHHAHGYCNRHMKMYLRGVL
jgi:hypothetical protein